MRIGVLSLQGNVREHVATLQALGVSPEKINKPEQLEGLDGLVLPGGESTTIGKLMVNFGLLDRIKERHSQGMGLFGTCAGLILLARDIENSSQPRLGLMDITAARNAFGRQIHSFEALLPVSGLEPDPVRAVFIRAPYISHAADGVERLATFQDRLVLARQGRVLAAAFHPELVGETRIHRMFLDMLTAERG